MRIISAVLREDRKGVLEALSNSDPLTEIGQFYTVISGQSCNFRALVARNIQKLQVVEPLQELLPALTDPLADSLVQIMKIAEIEFERLDEQFLQLLEELGDLGHRVVWLKGLPLSRTLYEKPSFRLMHDFDLLIEPGAVTEVMRRLVELRFVPPNIGTVSSSDFLNGLPLIMLEWPLHAGATPMGIFNFFKDGWPELDVKIDPLERGLCMKETERFFSETQIIGWREHSLRAPSTLDHLLIELIHLQKDGFYNPSVLLDIHLLTLKLAEKPDAWEELLRRCHHEGIAEVAWAALDVARDRLSTPIPDEVIADLDPNRYSWWARRMMFACPWFYLWFGGPVLQVRLLINTLFTEDKQRKTSVLWAHWFQSWEYLSLRWGTGLHPYSPWRYLFYLLFHWQQRAVEPAREKLRELTKRCRSNGEI